MRTISTPAGTKLTWVALQQALICSAHPLSGGRLEAIRIASHMHACKWLATQQLCAVPHMSRRYGSWLQQRQACEVFEQKLGSVLLAEQDSRSAACTCSISSALVVCK